jgi:hypothetical protein
MGRLLLAGVMLLALAACGNEGQLGERKQGAPKMMSGLRVGEAVPMRVFSEAIRRAILAARTGRSHWVDLGDVEGHFTIKETGTDLHVIGMGETNDSEFRLVDGVHYGRMHVSERPWKANANPLPGIHNIGNPLGLMAGLPEGDAVVVERVGDLTTFRLALSSYAFQRAVHGDMTADPEAGHEFDVPTDSYWVIDADDLVHEVTVPDQRPAGTMTFFDWGNAPEVAAPPPGQVEDLIDYYVRNGPAADNP